MYLAYLDDAGTDEHSPIVMCGAIIVFPDNFGHLESLHAAAIQQILAVEQIKERFSEFKASELYNGDGPFAGIDKARRFDAIKVLLTAVSVEKFPYIYAAIDRKRLKNSPLGSARPFDVAFRMCALGVEDWARSMHKQRPGMIQLDFKDLYLLIMDETSDRPLKEQLQSSYRSLRSSRPYIPPNQNRLWHAHDDLYFGDSRYSIGIQMVDLCNYFMWRHLLSEDGGEEFYEMFSKLANCARPEPEWTTYKGLFFERNETK